MASSILAQYLLASRFEISSRNPNFHTPFQIAPNSRPLPNCKKSLLLCSISRRDPFFAPPDCSNPTNSGFSVNQSLIREYTEMGSYEKSINCYIELLNLGISVHKFTFFPCLIKAFAGLDDLRTSKQIHGHVWKIGIGSDVYVMNSLLAMYWKCGFPEDALSVFDKMPEKDLVSWNTMLSGYNQSMQPDVALDMFVLMRVSGIDTNRVSFLLCLSSCASCGLSIHGRAIHCFIVKVGLDADIKLANAIIDMYMKCGDQKNAKRVFEIVSVRSNTVTWNVMISGYVWNGCFVEALTLFHKMLLQGMEPDVSTIVGVLEACSSLLRLRIGAQIHGSIIVNDLKNDPRVKTALLDMYCKCGDIDIGLKLFEQASIRNFVMWGAIIAGCAQNSYSIKALELFVKFYLEGGSADPVSVVSVLRACSSLTLKLIGMEIHAFSIKSNFDSDAFVGGALIDMYAKCGDIRSAENVLFTLPMRDVVSWNALLAGYARIDFTDSALEAFRKMQVEWVRPNAVTIAYILSICSRQSVLLLCKQIHGYLVRHMLESSVLVINSLIATYARCGDINNSKCLFHLMHEKNEISWNSMISGLGMHGLVDEAFATFDEMKAAGVKPNHITFTGILSACSHTGSIDEGCHHFRSMSEDYGILPQIEQYTCMVDLLGRAGHLEKAYELIMRMPCKPDALIWGSLLGSCKIHGNKELAERVANHIFEIDSDLVAYHVLLSNIYEDFGSWDAVDRVRASMKEVGLRKTPGCSWIVVGGKLHSFLASDKSHTLSNEIYNALDYLSKTTREFGYAPQLHSVKIGPD